jgi:hypothetical protein
LRQKPGRLHQQGGVKLPFDGVDGRPCLGFPVVAPSISRHLGSFVRAPRLWPARGSISFDMDEWFAHRVHSGAFSSRRCAD